MKVSLTRTGKCTVRIDKFDTWNLDHQLAYIILPALLQLKAIKHGIPGGLAKDIADQIDGQLVFDFIHDDKDEVFDKRVNEWDAIMDKMIWSFQQVLDGDYDDKYQHGTSEYVWVDGPSWTDPVTGETHNTHISKNIGDSWFDIVGHQLHEERIQEGLELFGKYYRSLWD